MSTYPPPDSLTREDRVHLQRMLDGLLVVPTRQLHGTVPTCLRAFVTRLLTLDALLVEDVQRRQARRAMGLLRLRRQLALQRQEIRKLRTAGMSARKTLAACTTQIRRDKRHIRCAHVNEADMFLTEALDYDLTAAGVTPR